MLGGPKGARGLSYGQKARHAVALQLGDIQTACSRPRCNASRCIRFPLFPPAP